MSSQKKLFTGAFGLLILGIAFFILGIKSLVPWSLPTANPTPSLIASASSLLIPANWEKAHVQRVVDGDTIELSDGRKLRYIGIDTPETMDPRRAVGCFGKEASSQNKSLVAGKDVELEKDVSDTDKYGRLLRYVYIASDSARLMVNDLLVRQGYAFAKSYPPDIKYQEQFTQAAAEARNREQGLWKNCPLP